MTIRNALLAAIGAAALLFIIAWVRRLQRLRVAGGGDVRAPTPALLLIGLITNFFDTLGIGGFIGSGPFKIWQEKNRHSATPPVCQSLHAAASRSI